MDMPGIRPGYVSAACPRIPGYVGRKLKNGDVSARSIRPSSPVASFRDLLPSPDLTQPPPPHARAKGPDGIGSSPSPAPPRAAVLPVALRLASPFASQIDAAAPASPFASQIDADKPASGARVALRLPDWAPSSAADSRSSSRRRLALLLAPPSSSRRRCPPRVALRLPDAHADVLARDNGVASTAAAGWLGARQQHLLCRPGSLPAPFPSFPLPFLSNFYQSLFPRRQ